MLGRSDVEESKLIPSNVLSLCDQAHYRVVGIFRHAMHVDVQDWYKQFIEPRRFGCLCGEVDYLLSAGLALEKRAVMIGMKKVVPAMLLAMRFSHSSPQLMYS